MSKGYLRSVLREHFRRQQLHEAIKSSILKLFVIERGAKVKRGAVHSMVCDDLNLMLNNETQLRIRKAIMDLGVLPMASNGRLYYRNLKAR